MEGADSLIFKTALTTLASGNCFEAVSRVRKHPIVFLSGCREVMYVRHRCSLYIHHCGYSFFYFLFIDDDFASGDPNATCAIVRFVRK